MKKKEVTIDGVTYRVGSSTEEGLKKAIAQLKRSLKPKKQSKKKTEE
jgi:hypothetical protein